MSQVALAAGSGSVFVGTARGVFLLASMPRSRLEMDRVRTSNGAWRILMLALFAVAPAVLLTRVSATPALLIIIAFVSVVLLAAVLAAFAGALTLRNSALILWTLLISYRAFIPRNTGLDMSGFAWDIAASAEVLVTVVIFTLSLFLFLGSVATNRLGALPLTIKLLGLYAIVAVASLLYTPRPFYAGFWLMRLVSSLALFAVYFGSAGPADPTVFAGFTVSAMLPTVFLPWIYILQGASLSHGRFAGSWLHPIQTSIVAYTVGTFFLLPWVGGCRNRAAPFIAAACFASGFIGAGKVAVVVVGAVLLVTLLTSIRRWFSFRVVSALVLIALAIGLLLLTKPDLGLLAHWQTYQHSDFGTLKGRFSLWDVGVSTWLDSPIVGRGFASTRILQFAIPGTGWTPSNAHSSFLEPLIEVGLLGAMPLFVAIFIVLSRIIRLGPPPFPTKSVTPIAAAWCVLLLCGSVDMVFGGLLHPPTYMFYGLLVCLDAATRILPSLRESRGRP